MKTLTKEFHPAIQRFIESSEIESKEKKYSLVKSLFDKFEDENNKEKSTSKFDSVVQDITQKKEIQTLVKDIPNIKNKIAEDLILFIKNTQKEILKKEYDNNNTEESEFLQNINNLKIGEFESKKVELLPDLKKYHQFKDITNLYKKLENKEKSKDEKQILLEMFKEDWQKNLDKKQLDLELVIIEKQREKFLKELFDKIDKLSKLYKYISPFTKDLGRFWDMSEGFWQNVDFDVLAKYEKLLEKDKSLQELIELLGRLQVAQKEIEELEFRDIRIVSKPRIVHANKEEIIGIKESDDLNHTLPMEIGLLNNKKTKSIFFKKFIDKQLQTFDFQSKDIEQVQEEFLNKKENSKDKNKGPFIICVDTSGSMHGTPENIAKMITYCILKIASKENRKAFLISFSTSIETLELSDIENSMDKIVEFLSMSFHGGTNSIPAIKKAIEMTNEENYKKADVLMISDFIMPKFDDKTIELVKKAKYSGTKFYSLSITNSSNQNILNDFDENWIYTTNDRNMLKKIVADIGKLTTQNS